METTINDEFFLLKITLTDTQPVIWPRFVVPGEIMADPKHEEHQEMKEWFAGHPATPAFFSADHFNLVEMNSELAKFLRWSRDREIFWNRIS